MAVLALCCYLLFLLHPILGHTDMGVQSSKHSPQPHTLSLQDDLDASCPVCKQLGGNAVLKPHEVSWLPWVAKANPADIFYERHPVYPVKTDDTRAPPVSSPQ